MPLQPKLLDYENTQFLLIGHADNSLEKATEQPKGMKDGEDTPLEEMEKLEHEDEIRVEHLKGWSFRLLLIILEAGNSFGIGDDSVFEDLGLSSKEYSKIQTTW